MIDPNDAGQLKASLSYQGIEPQGHPRGSFLFDPRFLVFEFIHNIMLRDQQVQLVQEFMSAVSDPTRGSTCQQLIMGAGKTTVRVGLGFWLVRCICYVSDCRD